MCIFAFRTQTIFTILLRHLQFQQKVLNIEGCEIKSKTNNLIFAKQILHNETVYSSLEPKEQFYIQF